MELRTVNTFLHIAELHSFSRAARELGYSQSAVSSQIAQLEAELETPLFDRVGKTVRLTDAGQTFLSYARTLLTTAQQARAALQPAQQVRGTPASRTGGLAVQRIPARPAAALSRTLPAGGACALHGHFGRDAAMAGHESGRSGLHTG